MYNEQRAGDAAREMFSKTAAKRKAAKCREPPRRPRGRIRAIGPGELTPAYATRTATDNSTPPILIVEEKTAIAFLSLLLLGSSIFSTQRLRI